LDEDPRSKLSPQANHYNQRDALDHFAKQVDVAAVVARGTATADVARVDAGHLNGSRLERCLPLLGGQMS
jgi:hypothetical protein